MNKNTIIFIQTILSSCLFMNTGVTYEQLKVARYALAFVWVFCMTTPLMTLNTSESRQMTNDEIENVVDGHWIATCLCIFYFVLDTVRTIQHADFVFEYGFLVSTAAAMLAFVHFSYSEKGTCVIKNIVVNEDKKGMNDIKVTISSSLTGNDKCSYTIVRGIDKAEIESFKKYYQVDKTYLCIIYKLLPDSLGLTWVSSSRGVYSFPTSQVNANRLYYMGFGFLASWIIHVFLVLQYYNLTVKLHPE